MNKSLLVLIALAILISPSGSTLCQTKPMLEPEDWHKLAVKRGQFSATGVIDAGVQSQPGFTRQLLQVQWRQGDPIDLYIVRPENAVKPPVVIFLYSWPDDTDRFRSDAWCRSVTSHGFAAVGFVSALTGQRYHSRAWKQTFVSELPEALGKTVHDVQLLLDYLDTRNDLDAKHAGIFGQGSGGTIALLSASVEPRLKAVDVIDPWGDWPDWFAASPIIPESERSHFSEPAFLKLVSTDDPLLVLSTLSGRAVRLEQTNLNPSTPRSAADRLRRVLPATLSYTNYLNESEYRTRAMEHGRILEWMQEELETPRMKPLN